eukprot:s870_g7.t1
MPLSKRPAIRLRPNDSQPEQILQRVDTLKQVFLECGVLRPMGDLSERMQNEWHTGVTRLAQDKVTQADKATIINCVRTFVELRTFMAERGRVLPPEELDLISFVNQGTEAPVRALNGLRWLVKNGNLGWPLSGVRTPVPTEQKTKKKSQAVVVEPPMMSFLEDQIEENFRLGNSNWRRLLGSWLVAQGCLRYRHVSLSTPVKLTLSTIHARCAKGKQVANRHGFDWAAPARFTSDFAWAEAWLQDFQKLPVAVATKAGFCFDNQGNPYSIKDIQAAARDLFQGLVEPLEGLTTYSFRRLMPTVGHMLEFSEEEMLALGDWTDQDKSKAAMPHLYSAARYTQSVYCAVAHLAEFEAWEVIPRTALFEADVLAQQEMDRKLQQDLTVVWALPPDAVQLQAHFRLSEELTAAAKKKRSSEQRAASGDPMPAELKGFVLTQTLKDGARLCTAFNTASCQQGDRCADRHLCAVVLQTGRACGGKHPAKDCWGRRAMKVERFQEMRPGSVPSAKEEEPPTREEADTSDESSSSSISVTAPTSSKPKTPAEAASAKRQVKAKASPAAADHPKGPAKRAERPPEPKEPPKKKARQEAPGQAAGSDPVAAPELIPIPDMVPLGSADRRFDLLATVSGKQTEMPSMVLQLRGGGELWISGIPTKQTKHHFPPAQLQVCCMAESPERRGGITLEGAVLRQFPIADARARQTAWKALFPLVRRSLFQGDTVLFHCVAGRHRAAVAGTVVYAIMGRCNIQKAEEGILKRRPIKLQQAFQDRGLADWAHRTVATTTLTAPLPKAMSWAATEKSHVHILTDNNVPLCAHKQGESRPRALKDPYITADKYEALAWSLPFCAGCRDRAPASFLCRERPGAGGDVWEDEVGQVEKWMSKLSLGEEANIQAARVRRAWNAVTLYYRNFETDRSKVSATDLDSLLDDSELRTHKQNFWVRYKLRFPTEQYPSDATVSRVTRELDKRMLCVTSVWKVKSLQWQLMTTNRKRKLGEGLFTEEPELEEPGPKDVDHYLDRLHTLMLAYALAGSSRLSGAPPAKDEDVMGSDTTKFVGAPLDILLKYHSRAKRVVMQLAPGKRLNWLQTKDLEERSEWVSKYRESTRTLGAIVKETYEARDAHWVVVASTEVPSAVAPTAQSSAPDSASSHFQLGQKVNGKVVAKTMRDGTVLCPAFQQGNCKHKGASCPKGARKCGVVIKGQRICNAASHGASTCSTRVRA